MTITVPSGGVLLLLVLGLWLGRTLGRSRRGVLVGGAVAVLGAVVLGLCAIIPLTTTWNPAGHGGAFLLGVPLAWWWWRRQVAGRVAARDLGDLALVAMLGGLAGGRGLYLLVYGPDNHPWWDLDGGMILYGGAGAGALLAWWLARHRCLPVALLGDTAAAPAALLLAAGRVGCHLNGCCHGRLLAAACVCSTATAQGPAIPAQLLEAGAAGLLAAGLAWRGPSVDSGRRAVVALAAYAGWCFIAEYWRGDPRPGWWGLSHSQWLSLLLLVAMGLLWRRLMIADRQADDPTAPRH